MKDLHSRWNLPVVLALIVISFCFALPAHAQRFHSQSLMASAPRVYFGNVAVGGTRQVTEYIYNGTGADVTITAATSSDNSFQLASPGLPVTVTAGRWTRLSLSFTPAASGSDSGTLTITSTAAQPTLTISMSGNGLGSSGQSGQLVVNPNSLTFGSVNMGSSQTLPASLTNNGSGNVTISQANSTTSDFTISGLSLPLTLQPNQSVNFNVTFSPASGGARQGTIALGSSGGSSRFSRFGQRGGQSAALQVSGTGASSGDQTTPGVLSVNTNPVSFGTVPVGSTQTRTTTITNTGGSNVSIKQFSIAGGSFKTSSAPMSLGAGKSASVDISCTPQSAGNVSGTLTVMSDASNSSLAVSLAASAVTPGALSASSTPLAFGSVTVGGSKSLPETLTNNGGTTINLTSAAAGSGFTVKGLSLPAALTAGQSVQFNVEFDPTSAGAANVNLAIANDSPTPTLTIPLSGTGTSAGAISTSAVSFGSVQVNGNSTLQTTIKNTGGSSVTISQANLTGGPTFSIGGITTPLTLTAGQSFTFSVSFTPTSAGAASGSIALVSDAASPASPIALSGTGTAPGQFAVSPATFSFGNVTVGANKALTATLSATGSSVTVSSASVDNVEYKLTGPSLPTTIQAGKTATFTLTFTPQDSGTSNGNLSFTTSASATPLSESISGNGVAAPQHSVTLSWNASSSSVTGYNVYRGTTNGGPYSKLNPGPTGGTSFTDSSVKAGTSYFYVTTSVASDGTESSYSNQVQASVPTP